MQRVISITNMANAQKALGQFQPASAAYRPALALRPHLDAHVNLGNLLHKLGLLDQVEVEYEAALSIDPMCAAAESNLLLLHCHRAQSEAAKLLERHRAFGARYAHLEGEWLPPQNASLIEGHPIRLGFISGDLRNHPVVALLGSRPTRKTSFTSRGESRPTRLRWLYPAKACGRDCRAR